MVYTLVGPPLGLLIIASITSISHNGLLKTFSLLFGVIFNISAAGSAGMIILSYAFGIIPAFMSGVLSLYVFVLGANRAMRLVLSVPVGAAAIVAWSTFGFREIDWMFPSSLFRTALFGGLVSLLCTSLNEIGHRATAVETSP
ncbi:hypothetical protein [Methylobacterium sp. J-068]|uniref:hypothetical protein n=1 Tax=Methylobacterium sp. J-068 TaxID=2836649 RepID=UPI001FBBEC62|nr:hypothetical protein [Methylobacterium sp. J-068]MCJ2034374.1 hypothetical protein [Methylobacterium sp. J-068]